MSSNTNISTARNKSWIFCFAFVSCLGWINFSYVFSMLNEAGDQTFYSLGWTDEDQAKYRSISSSIVTISGGITILLVGLIFPKTSRRLSIIVTDLLNIAGCILTLSSSILVFIIGRVMLGLGNGLTYAMIPIFIREMSPPEISGRVGSLNKIMFSLGLVLSFGLGMILPYKPESNNEFWKVIMIVPGLISLIRLPFFLFIFRFDSPKYYILHNKHEQSKNILAKIYKPSYHQKGYEDILSQKNNEGDSSLPSIFSRYKSQFLACLIVVFLQDFTGLPAMNFFSTQIILGSNEGNSGTEDDAIYQARLANVGMGLLRTFASFSAGLFLDKFGRRTLYLGGNIFVIVSLSLLGFSVMKVIPELARPMVLLFALGSSLSYGLINPLYLPECLPVKAVSVLVLIDVTLQFLIVTFFDQIQKAFLLENVVYFFAFSAIVGQLLMYIFIKETKGLTMNEIYRLFTKQKDWEDYVGQNLKIEISNTNAEKINKQYEIEEKLIQNY